MAVSSFLGTTIEYYDFLLYGTAAALIFNKVFFADLTPVVGTIVALATLAAGYLARLAGALVFGHFGDRLGRKSVMLTTMVVMGTSSGLIGLLPTYAHIGAAAPLLLVFLRLCQGIAVGGEFGGAVLMTTEHARDGRRGRATVSAVAGAPAGSLLATGVMLLVTLLPEKDLLSWGWRLPFLASFVLLAVGLWFRARISESPVFTAHHSTRPAAGQRPLTAMLRRSRRRFLLAVLVQLGPYFGNGVFALFVVSYAASIGYTRSAALDGLIIGLICSIAMTPVYAGVSDRVGRRPFIIAGCAALALLAYPLFLMINTGSVLLLVLAVAVYVAFVLTPVTAVAPVLLSELFPTEVRYTATSTSYQLAQTVGSGFGPLIAASLIAAAGGGTNVGLLVVFLIVFALVSTVAACLLPETRTTTLIEAMPAIKPDGTPKAVTRL
ncbi:MFS transporter [Streptomyces malaysiensis]|uniref:MFS transporter n=1 Tax=Streptomyces malaysiensis TaxID=92644 RepID=UPI002B2E6420|nr:MFS transporter [Streptomyces malaysiensis]